MNFTVWSHTSKKKLQIWHHFAQLHESIKPIYRSFCNGATKSSFFLSQGCFANSKQFSYRYVVGGILKKLDGVGTVDNRTTTD